MPRNLPKSAYFYWAGKMSFLRYMTLHSFRSLNPDWKITLITRWNTPHSESHGLEIPDVIGYGGTDYFLKAEKLKIKIIYIEDEYPEIAKMDYPELHIGDILMWKVLGERGGIFSDMDILYFRPVDYGMIKDSDISMIQFSGYPKVGYMPTSFIAGKPNNAFKALYRHSIKTTDPKVWDSSGERVLSSLFGSIEKIKENYPKLKINRLPSKIVFPFSETKYGFNSYSQLMYERNVAMPDEGIGIHLYASTPSSQGFNNIINDKNYKNFGNTISKLIGETYG